MNERRGFWLVLYLLCGIAIAASIRRLIALGHPPSSGIPQFDEMDSFFLMKPGLTRSHVIAGAMLAAAIPVQFSARVRTRYPRVHRWMGRVLVPLGIAIAATGYAMALNPVGGWVEVSAVVFYATAFIAALVTAWRRIRQRDVLGHRAWMLRAMAIVLGIATTRPVMGVFFATSPLTGLTPAEFFGPALWMGFTATAAAGELYVRKTRT
jgi:hypothetical protein